MEKPNDQTDSEIESEMEEIDLFFDAYREFMCDAKNPFRIED